MIFIIKIIFIFLTYCLLKNTLSYYSWLLASASLPSVRSINYTSSPYCISSITFPAFLVGLHNYLFLHFFHKKSCDFYFNILVKQRFSLHRRKKNCFMPI